MKKPSKIDITLAFVFYILNAVDCFTTLYVVGIAGTDAELNPFMRMVLEHGEGSFMAVKLGGGLALTVAMLFMPTSKRLNSYLIFMTVVYFLLAAYHLTGIIYGYV